MKAKLLVVLVSAFLLVAMDGYLQQRYASPAEATLVLTELSSSDYPPIEQLCGGTGRFNG